MTGTIAPSAESAFPSARALLPTSYERLVGKTGAFSGSSTPTSANPTTKLSVAPPTPHIAHVHIDAFFAAVEESLRPRLRNKPVLVGRSSVLAASYEAQLRGITPGMAVAQARTLCPSAITLPPRFDRYAEAAERLLSILESFTSAVDPDSHHGFTLNFFGSPRISRDFPGTLRRIQLEILKRTGLSVAIGAAHSRIAAAIAARLERPRGLRIIIPGFETTFLASLPALPGLDALCAVIGIDPTALRQRGITTIAELRRVPVAALEFAFTPPLARQLWLNSRAQDDRLASAQFSSHQSTKPHSSLPAALWSQLKSLSGYDAISSLLESSRSARSAQPLSSILSREAAIEPTSSNSNHLSAITGYLCKRLSLALHDSHRQASSIALRIRYSDHFFAAQSIALPASTTDARQLQASTATLLETLFTRPVPVASLEASLTTTAITTTTQSANAELEHSAVA
jgi:nucleotidyltransferase/DNA polymerase involved in DNA repair